MSGRKYIGPRERAILAEQAKVHPDDLKREHLVWFGIRLQALVQDGLELSARIELINLLKFRIN